MVLHFSMLHKIYYLRTVAISVSVSRWKPPGVLPSVDCMYILPSFPLVFHCYGFAFSALSSAILCKAQFWSGQGLVCCVFFFLLFCGQICELYSRAKTFFWKLSCSDYTVVIWELCSPSYSEMLILINFRNLSRSGHLSSCFSKVLWGISSSRRYLYSSESDKAH